MNINRENIDDLNAVISIQLGKEDYEQKVEEVIADYRKKVSLDGFRKGKVPAGIVRRMYGKAILVEQINKIVSDALSDFLYENKLNILGEPIPNKDQKQIDFDTQSEFEFRFDIGLTPEVEVKLSKRDKIPFYEIIVDDAMIDSNVENYRKQLGNLKESETVSEKSMIKANLVQVTKDSEVIEGGIVKENAVLSVDKISDKATQKKLVGMKIGESLKINIVKSLVNETEISALLGIKKEEVKAIAPEFTLTINEISEFEDAEINQELFDKAFGKDVVKTEEEFRNKLAESIKLNFSKESEYRFMIDAKEKVNAKIETKLPEDFLKRWLLAVNEGKDIDAETIDKEFPLFLNDLKWQLIKSKVITENNIEVKEEEVLGYAIDMTRAQFAQYGLTNLPDEHLEGYAKEMLKKDEERKKMFERIFEQKVVDFIKESVKLEPKEVSVEEFGKLFTK